VPENPRISILLVEDHLDTANAMGRLLNHCGYGVRAADCVADALQAAAEQEFDLLISDIGLPDGTGLELMRQLLGKRPIKGIALSGYAMPEHLQQSREAGFCEHLVKPVSFAQLEAAIGRVVGQK
jgi:CheY-like chemotaxis protein